MDSEKSNGLKGDVPIVLSKWYDVCKWILAKVDSFPKNQRFIFGTRHTFTLAFTMENKVILRFP